MFASQQKCETQMPIPKPTLANARKGSAVTQTIEQSAELKNFSPVALQFDTVRMQ